MQNYELTYLLLPHISEDEKNSVQERLRALIESEGGVLGTTISPTLRKLAYPIEKELSAHIGGINFYFDQAKLPDLSQNIRKEGFFLRFLLISKPARKAKTSQRKTPRIKPQPAQATKESKVELEQLEEKLEEILKE